jgi:hypothetical protein
MMGFQQLKRKKEEEETALIFEACSHFTGYPNNLQKHSWNAGKKVFIRTSEAYTKRERFL